MSGLVVSEQMNRKRKIGCVCHVCIQMQRERKYELLLKHKLSSEVSKGTVFVAG